MVEAHTLDKGDLFVFNGELYRHKGFSRPDRMSVDRIGVVDGAEVTVHNDATHCGFNPYADVQPVQLLVRHV